MEGFNTTTESDSLKMAIQLDDFGKLALRKYVDTVEQYNGMIAATKSVESIDDFRESFAETWEGVADINVKIEQLRSSLETLLGQRTAKIEPVLSDEYAKAQAATGVDPEAMSAKLKEVNASKKYLVSIYGDDVLEDTPKVEARRSGGSGGGGGGGRRIRGFDVYIDGDLATTTNADGEQKSTFSAAAKELGVATTDLQRAFFDAAESTDLKSDSFPSVVDFTFNEKNIRAVKVDDSSDA